MEEEHREVEDAAGHGAPVHQHVLLPQVPPPRPHLRGCMGGLRVWASRAEQLRNGMAVADNSSGSALLWMSYRCTGTYHAVWIR